MIPLWANFLAHEPVWGLETPSGEPKKRNRSWRTLRSQGVGLAQGNAGVSEWRWLLLARGLEATIAQTQQRDCFFSLRHEIPGSDRVHLARLASFGPCLSFSSL